MYADEFGFGLKCHEFFALASSELALPLTPLLLRFFSPFPVSAAARPGGLVFPLRFSPAAAPSIAFEAASPGLVDEAAVVDPVEPPPASGPVSFGGDPELPNILFSKPPCEE